MTEAETEHIKIFTDIAQQLGKLNGNMTSVLQQLVDHNNRITALENHPSNFVTYKEKPEYNWITQWLIKGLMICLGIIATLTGASGIIQKIFGN